MVCFGKHLGRWRPSQHLILRSSLEGNCLLLDSRKHLQGAGNCCGRLSSFLIRLNNHISKLGDAHCLKMAESPSYRLIVEAKQAISSGQRNSYHAKTCRTPLHFHKGSFLQELSPLRRSDIHSNPCQIGQGTTFITHPLAALTGIQDSSRIKRDQEERVAISHGKFARPSKSLPGRKAVP